MQIMFDTNNKYINQNNFKGTLAPSLKTRANKLAKEDAKHLLLTSGKSTPVTEDALLKIKENFNSALKVLAQKAKLMHPDTIANINKSKWFGGAGSIYDFNLVFENKNFGSVLELSFDHFPSYDKKEGFGGNLKKKVEALDPQEIDRLMLKEMLQNFESDIWLGKLKETPIDKARIITRCLKHNKDDISKGIISRDIAKNIKNRYKDEPKIRMDKIKKYKEELGNTISEEENKIIDRRLENAFTYYTELKESEEKHQQTLQKNQKLVNKIFG